MSIYKAYAVVGDDGHPLEVKLKKPSEWYLKIVAWNFIGGRDTPGNTVHLVECTIEIPDGDERVKVIADNDL